MKRSTRKRQMKRVEPQAINDMAALKALITELPFSLRDLSSGYEKGLKNRKVKP